MEDLLALVEMEEAALLDQLEELMVVLILRLEWVAVLEAQLILVV